MKRSVIFFSVVLILTVLAGPSYIRRASAAVPGAYFYTVRRFRTTSLPPGTGLAFDPANGTLLALNQADMGRTFQVQEFDRILEDPAGAAETAVSVGDPVNITFDASRGMLLAYGATSGSLTSLAKDSNQPGAAWQAAGSQRLRGAEQLEGTAAGGEGANIRGITLNTETGMLFLLNETAKRISGYQTGDNTPIQQIPLVGMDGTQPRGLAWNPNNGHFYTADAGGGRVLEIGTDGQVVAVLDLTAAHLKVTGGLVFAPSGDETDDPTEHSLYVAAEYLDSGESQIVELTLTAPPQVLADEYQMNGLVRTINAYAWQPSSPDTAGISYWPAKGSYLVSDSEVEGYSGYVGNLYQMAISGALQTTYSAKSFTSEPTGVAVNKNTGEIFISDDDRDRVFVVNTGQDGQLLTGDDQITPISTNNSVYRSTDPEGVGWGEGLLFIVDGTNSQVYVLHPGANGRFDGVPSSGDDVLVRQFDTEKWGVADPEGIDYNPQTGTLFIAGNNSRDVLIECTVEGELVRSWNISSIPSQNPAGIGVGPSSYNPAIFSVYMTDRGSDSSSTYDGKIFEIDITGGSAPTPTHTPTRTPTQTPTRTSTPSPLLKLRYYMPVMFK